MIQTFDGIPRMPAMFGRQAGPRQRPDREGLWPAGAGSTLVTWAVAQAKEQQLAALLPAGFVVAEPLLIVEARTLSNLPWLAGRGYEMLLVSVPVVYRYGALEQRGRLELVTWENRPDAIISGREELGWNKLYADTMIRSRGAEESSVCYRVAWDGYSFFDLDVKLEGDPFSSPGSWRNGPLMHYRVLPRTERWGEVEVEQVTAAPAPAPTGALQGGTGTFRFHGGTFEQLPTLHHIVNRLANLELGRVIDVGQGETASWADLSNMQVLSSSAPQTFAVSVPGKDPSALEEQA